MTIRSKRHPGTLAESVLLHGGRSGGALYRERAADDTWIQGRVGISRNAISALEDLHRAGENGEPMPAPEPHSGYGSVRHDNTPILTALPPCPDSRGRHGGDSSAKWNEANCAVAPEVRSLGLGGADTRSDIYSFMRHSVRAFAERDDEGSRKARDVLTGGLEDDPGSRSSLQALHDSLSEMWGNRRNRRRRRPDSGPRTR